VVGESDPFAVGDGVVDCVLHFGLINKRYLA
jgi:hypothetical protein